MTMFLWSPSPAEDFSLIMALAQELLIAKILPWMVKWFVMTKVQKEKSWV
jgi:hypothetical protein